MMPPEPRWRLWLNWAAVIAFFSFPIVFFLLQIIGVQSPWFRFEEHVKEFSWTRDYFKVICFLVLGLAGLNSWDKRNGAK
jgi:hypothetical protein